MPQLVTDIQQRIDARLAELRPLVEEYRELLDLRERIDAQHPGGTPRRRATDPLPDRLGADAREGTATATRPAEAEQQPQPGSELVTLIAQHPGITADEMLVVLGGDKSYLYRELPALQRRGAIRKQGKGYFPV